MASKKLSLLSSLRKKMPLHFSGSALITFGAPRTGNAAYARLHDSLIPYYKKLRFVYNKDPAPHIPPKTWFGFVHPSREIWIQLKKTRKFAGFRGPWWKKRPYWTTRTGRFLLRPYIFYMQIGGLA